MKKILLALLASASAAICTSFRSTPRQQDGWIEYYFYRISGTPLSTDPLDYVFEPYGDCFVDPNSYCGAIWLVLLPPFTGEHPINGVLEPFGALTGDYFPDL